MTKRKPTSPSLYDLMKKRPGAPAPPSDDVEPDLEFEVDEEEMAPAPPVAVAVEAEAGSWLAPGRVIRMPVGYLLLGGAGVIVVAMLMYSVGFLRGREIEQAAHERSILAGDLQPNPTPRVRDPLVPPRVAAETVLGRPETAAPRGDGTEPAWPPPARDGDEPAPRSQWGPMDVDPRIRGFNYFVLMETVPDGARKLAEYCREEGLETYVVPSHNSSSRRLVIALPGYSALTSRTSPEVQELRTRIESIGDRWQRHRSGATDLHDAYPHRYGSN